ncbi:hypothetical protein K438DRAFT_1765141 [Mycena galopus ATCC 62051]|nr:hypothetical protein K438DRAFT_1765141 [Mycena galopus ATCC 62051]
MKFISTTLITLALSVIAAFAVPATSPVNTLEKRSEKCKIVANGARCRKSPSTSATIFGEFFTGDEPTFSCFSIGTSVSGSTVWDRTTVTLASGTVECFVSDTLVALPCPGGLPEC